MADLFCLHRAFLAPGRQSESATLRHRTVAPVCNSSPDSARLPRRGTAQAADRHGNSLSKIDLDPSMSWQCMALCAKAVHCTDMPLILLNKPHQVLSQFRDNEGRRYPGGFRPAQGSLPGRPARLRQRRAAVYLTDDGKLQARISQPEHRLDERPTGHRSKAQRHQQQLRELETGVELKDGRAQRHRFARIAIG